jgi:ubiquinone/menaquinone biosynthesis C-methylase UbiE
MKDQEYDSMARLESTFWWHRSLHGKVISLLGKLLAEDQALELLDVGCGTGGMLRQLEKAFPRWRLSGLDISEKAVVCSLRDNHADFVVASANSLPYEDGAFDVLVSLDVMCHDLVCPKRMLCECARVLKPEGILVLNLPAYRWLRSYHDAHVQQSRRYTIKSLKAQVAKGPFECIFASYWNALLFLPLVIRRKVLPGRPSSSDVIDTAPLLNACFTRAMQWETEILRRGYRLPFGSSVFFIGRKIGLNVKKGTATPIV